VLVLTAAGLATAHAAAAAQVPVRVWTIHYRAHDGLVRNAYVELPAWYGPGDDPPLPLVISPHGRGVPAHYDVRYWGDLPAAGRFAVVCPEGQGRKLALYSWGDPGEISDLARMPRIVTRALPWLRIDRRRIYAVGGSMGGQEALLLAATHPHLLAGVVSFDADTNLALRYRDFAVVPSERRLRMLAAYEVGGTPTQDPLQYALRSPSHYARALAFAGIPIEIWWSRTDRVVVDQAQNSGALYRRIVALNPEAPVSEVVGDWRHTAEMWYFRRLPQALVRIGLLPDRLGRAERDAILPVGFRRPMRRRADAPAGGGGRAGRGEADGGVLRYFSLPRRIADPSALTARITKPMPLRSRAIPTTTPKLPS
jgi:pimeloyl-ACP methyl ester carboxylesterase